MAAVRYNVTLVGGYVSLQPEILRLDAGDRIDFGNGGKKCPVVLDDPNGHLAITLRHNLSNPALKVLQRNGVLVISVTGSVVGPLGGGEGPGSQELGGGEGPGSQELGGGEGPGSQELGGGEGPGSQELGGGVGALSKLAGSAMQYNANDHHFLAFKMPTQKPHLHWCWAATAAGVVNFFNGNRRATPCRIASGYLHVSNCCSTPEPCDQDARLDLVLEELQRLALSGVRTGPATMEELRKAIVVDQTPVCVRIEWDTNGRGHFVTIVGFSGMKGSEVIDIKDPFFGSSSIKFSAFPQQYESGATWTHSFFTEK